MDDLEPHDPVGPSSTTQPEQQSPDEETSPASSTSANLVTRLVLTALGGLVCVFLWPSGGQMTIVALVVLAVVVWFGPWTSAPQADDADGSLSSPTERD